MNSWPQALQNACGVKATSDKALDKAEPHAERVLDRRPESDSCTSCRDFCSGERGLKKSKQRLNEINEFLTGKLDRKTHSQFSRGRNKSWAASRCLRRTRKACPGQPSPRRSHLHLSSRLVRAGLALENHFLSLLSHSQPSFLSQSHAKYNCLNHSLLCPLQPSPLPC